MNVPAMHQAYAWFEPLLIGLDGCCSCACARRANPIVFLALVNAVLMVAVLVAMPVSRHASSTGVVRVTSVRVCVFWPTADEFCHSRAGVTYGMWAGCAISIQGGWCQSLEIRGLW